MSTRLLYLISVIACILAAVVYWHKNDALSSVKNQLPRFDYWADDIQAVQTDGLGRVQFVLAAQHLEHDRSANSLHLKHTDASMYRYGNLASQGGAASNAAKPSLAAGRLRFEAQSAIWLQNNNTLNLAEGVLATYTPEQSLGLVSVQKSGDDLLNGGGAVVSTSGSSVLSFSAPNIGADINQKTLQAGSPVSFYALPAGQAASTLAQEKENAAPNTAQINAKMLHVDFNKGEYRFDDIQASYQPSH